MKTNFDKSAVSRCPNCSETKSCPVSHTPWLRVLLFHLALSALLLGPLPGVRAQTSGPEEYTFATLAGPDERPGAIDGTGSAAQFNQPLGVAVDDAGNVYVADAGNHTIRKVSPAGTVTTLAGLARVPGSADGRGSLARFNSPCGVAVDGAGSVYVADSGNNTIRKVTPGGVVTTLAGQAGNKGQEDGTGGSARFNGPRGIALDGAGNLYVAEAEGGGFFDSQVAAIRKISTTAVVTTLAASPEIDTSFHLMSGIAVDRAGAVYVVGVFWIWKVEPEGRIALLAGQHEQGTTDGTGNEARFWGPVGVTVDNAGNVYVTEVNGVIRKINPTGVVTTVAGRAFDSESVDGTGTEARFADPSGIAVDSAGVVYVADGGAIRKLEPGGVVSTLAGSWNRWWSSVESLDGPAHEARFRSPDGIAIDAAGNVYVVDFYDALVRKILPGGAVTTLAGQAGSYGSEDGPGNTARFCQPDGVAVDADGNLYVADWGNNTIRKIDPAGEVTTLAGLAGLTGSVDGSGSAARLNGPRDVAVDNARNVYVVEQFNHTVRRINPEGKVTTLAGDAGITGQNRFPKGGYADGLGKTARFSYPCGIGIDGVGNVYVADSGNHVIRKMTPGGVVTTVAGAVRDMDGNGQPDGGYADGSGGAARFNGPSDVAVDSVGNLYVTEWNGVIRKVTPAGVVTTLAGSPGRKGSADGTGSVAGFNEPNGIAVDSKGNLYVADLVNNAIRIGKASCADWPVVDLPLAPAGVARQLDTSPQTATAWQWNLIRRPAGSTAELSSATVRNPTFTPDVPDLYVFRLLAANGLTGPVSIRTLELSAVPANVAVLTSPQRRPNGPFQSTLIGQTNQAYTLQVSTNLTTWMDWTNVIPASFSTLLTDPAVAHDPQRFYRARTR